MAKIHYTSSSAEKDKVGNGWHIRAVPDRYAPELSVSFDSKDEAEHWLSNDSANWLAKLESSRNSKRPGVTDRLWDMNDLVAVLEAAEAAEARPKARGPYKKRAA